MSIKGNIKLKIIDLFCHLMNYKSRQAKLKNKILDILKVDLQELPIYYIPKKTTFDSG